MPNDKQPKKSTKAQLAQYESEKKLLAYLEERHLNIIQQLRAVCIAAKITPEEFWKAFVDNKAQDDFYIRLHVQEDLHNHAVNEFQVKKPPGEHDNLVDPKAIAETFGSGINDGKDSV